MGTYKQAQRKDPHVSYNARTRCAGISMVKYIVEARIESSVQRKAADEFAESWAGRGDEKQDKQPF